MKTISPKFISPLLLTICFTLATVLQQVVANWSARRSDSDNLLAITLGDARRMFADQFLKEADIYFHSGYYPSMFDEAQASQKNHLNESASEDSNEHEHEGERHEGEINFLENRPHDWIEKFGRNFFVTEHTELSGTDTRELLPWLRLSAELNPTNQAPYLLGAFALRRHVHKSAELLEFLREGLRANPDSYEILYELGRLFEENFHDAKRAENLWIKSLEKWEKIEGAKTEPDVTTYREALTQLATLKMQSASFAEAVKYLSRVKKLSPHPDEVQKQIDELNSKRGSSTNEPTQKP